MSHIILRGNLGEGYKVFGPFSTFDDAYEVNQELNTNVDYNGDSCIIKVEDYPHWLNNGVQYARLIEESQGAGAFTPTVLKDLAESTDLDWEAVAELMERARTDWEAVKANMPGWENLVSK